MGFGAEEFKHCKVIDPKIDAKGKDSTNPLLECVHCLAVDCSPRACWACTAEPACPEEFGGLLGGEIWILMCRAKSGILRVKCV